MATKTVRQFTTRSRSGFSLIEVMIASMVLLTGIATLAHLSSVGSSQSSKSQELAVVQVECQTRVNELVSGVIPIQPMPGQMIPGLDDWTLSVELQRTPMPTLVAAQVTALKRDPATLDPVTSYSLVRWMPMPKSDNFGASGMYDMSGMSGSETLPGSGAISDGGMFGGDRYEDDPFGDNLRNPSQLGDAMDGFPGPVAIPGMGANPLGSDPFGGNTYQDDPFGDNPMGGPLSDPYSDPLDAGFDQLPGPIPGPVMTPGPLY